MERLNLRPQFVILLLVVATITVASIPFNNYYSATGHINATNTANTADISSAATGITNIARNASFSSTLAWVKGVGYFVMFIAMVIEGPVITSAAAFAAALGYFNIFAVLALSIAGDLVGDFIYYGIGYFGRVHFVEKYGHHVGLTKKRLKHMERLIKEHPKKTLTAIKLAPLLPAPGLMMIGATRMRFDRYAWMTLLVALPKSLLFLALGYYFGDAYDRFSSVFQNGEYFILIAIVAIVVAFYAYKKISAVISTRLETI